MLLFVNYLSILVYLSEVLGNIKDLFVAAALISGAWAIIKTIVWGLSNERKPHPYEGFKKPYTLVAACFFLALMASLLPTQQTVRLIAASEIGETLAKTDTAKELGSEAADTLKEMLKTLKEKIKTDVTKEVEKKVEKKSVKDHDKI